MTDIPLQSNSRRPQFFESDANDALTSMVLELMAELWTVKERVYVLEQVLSDQAVSIKDKVESYEHNEHDLAHLEAKRAEFISNVMRSLESNTAASSS